jgi:hypothetical protein
LIYLFKIETDIRIHTQTHTHTRTQSNTPPVCTYTQPSAYRCTLVTPSEILRLQLIHPRFLEVVKHLVESNTKTWSHAGKLCSGRWMEIKPGSQELQKTSSTPSHVTKKHLFISDE